MVAGVAAPQNDGPADYTLTIATTPIELAPKRIISVTNYNGQFPGPLLRLKEGERVTIDVRNETDTPEQLHWHGQFGCDRCGWGGGRGHAVYSSARQPQNFVCAEACWFALLSHTRARRRESGGGAV